MSKETEKNRRFLEYSQYWKKPQILVTASSFPYCSWPSSGEGDALWASQLYRDPGLIRLGTPPASRGSESSCGYSQLVRPCGKKEIMKKVEKEAHAYLLWPRGDTYVFCIHVPPPRNSHPTSSKYNGAGNHNPKVCPGRNERGKWGVSALYLPQ